MTLKNTLWRIVMVVGLILSIAGTAAPAQTAAPAAGVAQIGGVPRFESGPCVFTVPPGITEGEEVECGWLVVPEEHANPDGPTIRLAVVIIRSQFANPEPDPLVLAQGGPGGSTIDYFTQVLFTSRLWSNRDLILFDQRGTLYSEPNLLCPEILDETIEMLDVNIESAEAEARFREAALACRERLAGEGINLSAFNSLENAADIDSLRQALGYEQVNLYGVSYGTLLALHAMRDYPQALRSVILDAVVPTSVDFNQLAPLAMDRAFSEFFNACAENEECSRAYPDLEQSFFDLYDRLEEKPVTIQVRDEEDGQVYDALMDGDSLLGTLFQLLYATELLPLLPKMIQDFSEGRYGFTERILSLITFDRSMSYGMYYSVVCSEDSDLDLDAVDYSAIRPQLSKDVEIGNEGLIELCAAWNVTQLDERVDAPVVSDLPVLVLNGRFDPITPASYGEEAAATLPNSFLFTFPNSGHGAATSSECADDIILQFLDNPSEQPDGSCIAELPAVDFVTGEDVVDLPVLGLILEGRTEALVGLVLVGLAALFLLTALAVYPLAWLVRLMRGKEGTPTPLYGQLAPWVAMATAGLTVLFLVLLVVAAFGPLLENNLIFLMGVPGNFRPLFLLVPVIILLALGMLALAVMGWKGKYWAVWRKVYFSLLTLATLVCAVWLVTSESLAAAV